jgi:RNA polymerase sigma factor (sigma-70 family)
MPPTDSQLSATLAAERGRLARYIRRHVLDSAEAEDILQEVFYELIAAYRLMKPIEQIGSWLMRVARNRIIDRFRRRQHAAMNATDVLGDAAENSSWEELLPDLGATPEAQLTREWVMQQFELALAELPALQRQIFIAHELEGRSFKELSAEYGVGINTLLSRKHAAVNSLRTRLKTIYEELDLD